MIANLTRTILFIDRVDIRISFFYSYKQLGSFCLSVLSYVAVHVTIIPIHPSLSLATDWRCAGLSGGGVLFVLLLKLFTQIFPVFFGNYVQLEMLFFVHKIRFIVGMN